MASCLPLRYMVCEYLVPPVEVLAAKLAPYLLGGYPFRTEFMPAHREFVPVPSCNGPGRLRLPSEFPDNLDLWLASRLRGHRGRHATDECGRYARSSIHSRISL